MSFKDFEKSLALGPRLIARSAGVTYREGHDHPWLLTATWNGLGSHTIAAPEDAYEDAVQGLLDWRDFHLRKGWAAAAQDLAKECGILKDGP